MEDMLYLFDTSEVISLQMGIETKCLIVYPISGMVLNTELSLPAFMDHHTPRKNVD